MARQKNLVSRLNELHRDIDMSRINYLCFSKLAAQEQKSWRAMGCSCVVLAARLKDTKERLKKEKERHTLLQKKYKELLVQIRNCSGVCFSYELGVSFFHCRVLSSLPKQAWSSCNPQWVSLPLSRSALRDMFLSKPGEGGLVSVCMITRRTNYYDSFVREVENHKGAVLFPFVHLTR